VGTRERAPGDAPERSYGRRIFLATVLGGLSSLAWGNTVWGWASGVISPVARVALPFLPSRGWRIYAVSGQMPALDRATWSLRVSGLVEQPLTLSYDDLRALPPARQVSTFHCVTGWTVNNVQWGGVRIADVLKAARPTRSARALRFISAEFPYQDFLTLDQALLPDVMLAYEMDGLPLRREHGAPLRLVVPEMYGYKSVKWLAQIELVPAAHLGYWENEGYDADAWIK
jgi:DMSO/TMAO reductase YedYZ molybdopterin-dependent catalytic subunit